MPLVENLLSLGGRVHLDFTAGVGLEFFLAQSILQPGGQISDADSGTKILAYEMKTLMCSGMSSISHMSAVLPNDQHRVIVVDDPDELFPPEPKTEKESFASLLLSLSRGYKYYEGTLNGRLKEKLHQGSRES